MLIIYHSRGALPARHAAAIHVGRAVSAGQLGGLAALEAEGLWAAGEDRWGRRVYALGRASRPDVVHRAFHGLASIFDLPDHTFLLQNVGPVVAWNDIGVKLLCRLGLPGLAAELQVRGVRRGWGAARRAVARVAEQLMPAELERR